MSDLTSRAQYVKSISLSRRAAALLDTYRKPLGLSYSQAIARLLGVELPTPGELSTERWKKRKETRTALPPEEPEPRQ